MSTKTTKKTPTLSVITPIYNEADGLGLFFEKVTPILEEITEDWEIICVDDGSKDRSYEILQEHRKKDKRIKILKLSRNFGKEAALSAGIDHANGDAVIPIDSDMQDPPEVILQLVEKWREGFRVVLATRKKRTTDSLLKRFTAWLFYKTIIRMSRTDIPENTGDFRLMDRQVVEVIKRLPERTRFMKGLFAWVGFRTCQVFYERQPRAKGKAKQSYLKLFRLAVDGIFSFSTIPLRIWAYIGMIISSISLVYALYLVIRTIIFGIDVPGYASIMTAVLFMGGVQLLSLGIIGEYIGRVYREVKHRPLYVVEEEN